MSIGRCGFTPGAVAVALLLGTGGAYAAGFGLHGVDGSEAPTVARPAPARTTRSRD